MRIFPPINHTELRRESVYLEVSGPKRVRGMKMKNSSMLQSATHKVELSAEPLESNQRAQFCTRRGALSRNGAYVVAFNYSLFFSRCGCQRGDSLGLSQPCSGQSVSAWVTACGTISCPAAQQECQGERAGGEGEGEDESRAMPSGEDEAHRGLSGNSTVAQIWLL